MDWDLLDSDLEANGSDLEMRRGVCVGGVIDVGLTPQLVLRLEPMYQPKGTRYKGYGGKGDFWIKSSYLEVPALLVFPWTRGGVRPYILAGPTLGLRLSATSNDDDIGGEHFGNGVRRPEVGVAVGGGVSRATPGYSLFLEGRYARALTSLWAGDPVKNTGGQVLLGVTFATRH